MLPSSAGRLSARVTFGAAAAIGLALLTLLPWSAAWIGTTAAIVILGVPHGALDGEIARPLLRPRFGRWWLVVFALPYLTLSAGVLLCWRGAPCWTLAAFLAASAWHFAEEGAPSTGLVGGGLPIALPVLLHPAATCAVFAAALQVPLPSPPAWLWAGCLGWLAAALVWLGSRLASGDWRACLPVLVLGIPFILLPPLTGFAIYFVALHAPAHMAGLVRHLEIAPRVQDMAGGIRLSLPITLLTLGLGAALWPLYAGAPAIRFLGLTLQVLAALTLPHMLLGYAVRRHWGNRLLAVP